MPTPVTPRDAMRNLLNRALVYLFVAFVFASGAYLAGALSAKSLLAAPLLWLGAFCCMALSVYNFALVARGALLNSAPDR